MKQRLLIGRRSSCDVSLRFPNVSSHHCELEMVNGYWFVRDLSSRNGIKVNGVRCDAKWLMPEDVLSVAKHSYEVTYAPRGDAPTPEDVDPFAIGLLEKAGLARRESEPGPPPRTLDAGPSKTPSKKDGKAKDFPIEWFMEE